MATATANDTVIEREALGWIDDVFEHFGWSMTRMHSVPREAYEAVQIAGINLRLEQRRPQIKVLEKLADAQGIGRIESLDDAAPLLMPHDTYKSYPVSLLAKQKFGQLTTWLSRLTHYDLSRVDASACQSIDDWLGLLQAETPLDVAASSGTSGTCSFFPKSKKDYETTFRGLRVHLTQRFGEEPGEDDIHGKIYAMSPLYRDGHAMVGRGSHYIKKVFCRDDPDYFHVALDFKLSTDMMWLAARLRAAAAKGDMSKVDVPPALLARRGEWEAIQKDVPAKQAAFIRRMTEELRGKRVLAMGTTNMFYPVARLALDDGVRGAFAPGSIVNGGGGAKGLVLPDDHEQVICDFFGVDRMAKTYGMTEMNTMLPMCEHGRYHLAPWVAVWLLDLDSGRPLPRDGVRTGRAAFLDLTQDGAWAGIVTGDLATIDWSPCACGRTTIGIDGKVQRVSEAQGGGEDKITCAATAGAQAEAVEYLTSLEG